MHNILIQRGNNHDYSTWFKNWNKTTELEESTNDLDTQTGHLLCNWRAPTWCQFETTVNFLKFNIHTNSQTQTVVSGLFALILWITSWEKSFRVMRELVRQPTASAQGLECRLHRVPGQDLNQSWIWWVSSPWTALCLKQAAGWNVVCTCSWGSRGGKFGWCWSPSGWGCPAARQRKKRILFQNKSVKLNVPYDCRWRVNLLLDYFLEI